MIPSFLIFQVHGRFDPVLAGRQADVFIVGGHLIAYRQEQQSVAICRGMAGTAKRHE